MHLSMSMNLIERCYMYLSNINVWDAVVMKWGWKLRLVIKNDVFFLRQFASSRAPAIDSSDHSWMGLFVAQEMQISDAQTWGRVICSSILLRHHTNLTSALRNRSMKCRQLDILFQG